MKKDRLRAVLALLPALALATGCAAGPAAPSSEAALQEADARTPGEGSGFAVQLEGDPPVSREVWENTVTPGFSDVTLPEAYLRAREVFRLFRGAPSHVEDFPREDGAWYEPGTLSREIDGRLYYRAWNRYESWADFEAMVQAVNFMLVAHYTSPQLYETDESFIHRRDNGDWDYLVEYPVRLVNTPAGWRVDAYERPY